LSDGHAVDSVAANAFFVVTEFAITRIRDTRAQQLPLEPQRTLEQQRIAIEQQSVALEPACVIELRRATYRLGAARTASSGLRLRPAGRRGRRSRPLAGDGRSVGAPARSPRRTAGHGCRARARMGLPAPDQERNCDPDADEGGDDHRKQQRGGAEREPDDEQHHEDCPEGDRVPSAPHKGWSTRRVESKSPSPRSAEGRWETSRGRALRRRGWRPRPPRLSATTPCPRRRRGSPRRVRARGSSRSTTDPES
jgi:hypothetical protein